MSVFEARYIKTKGHFAVGTEWLMLSKKVLGKVVMHDDGFECSCNSKQRCNHIRGVEQLLSNGDSFLSRCVPDSC